VGLLIVFLIAAFFTFSAEPYITRVVDWITSARVYGAFILIAVSAVVSWILVKAGK